MGKKLNFCIHCDYCIREKKGCIHKDDMHEVYIKLKWTDVLIIGTPVYQGMVSGQTKVIMDRCRAIAAQDLHFILNKPGAALPVGGGSFVANLGGALVKR